jgi:hypothetical protein
MLNCYIPSSKATLYKNVDGSFNKLSKHIARNKELAIASRCGLAIFVKYLLDNNFYDNVNYGLEAAIRNDHLDIVRLLINMKTINMLYYISIAQSNHAFSVLKFLNYLSEDDPCYGYLIRRDLQYYSYHQTWNPEI